MPEVLLHGVLHATIYEVDNIQNQNGASNVFSKSYEYIKEIFGYGKGTQKLYATVDIGNAIVGQTRMLNAPVNPKWNESFHIYCAHVAADIIFSVNDANLTGATLIGRAFVPVQDATGGLEIDRWVEILDEGKKPTGSKIHVELQYFDVSKDGHWAGGIKSQKFPGVPYTYFSQRQGCRVSLYQDAHIPDGFVPKIPLSGGKFYEPRRCWEDMFDAITSAKHMIYIAGWSVYTEITFIRDSRRPRAGGDVTLGELLKKRASEGVRVLMLVWEDRTATAVEVLKKDGLMATHSEETKLFFKGTDVTCILCPRNPDNGSSVVEDLEIATMFTHHQKILIVDSPMPSGGSEGSEKRRIVSFVGGLDLCDGRYDSPFHPLFGTLGTTHHNDFHQPNFKGATIQKGGPREPWHDIHSMLEGPIAWDVLFNFEQRWKKQGTKDLLHLDDIIITPSPAMFLEDPESWNVQLFRSIDGGASFGFPTTPEDAAKAGLISGKDSTIDRSIQDAYINAIRRAKNFIYIENQYFLGSSFGWKPDDGVNVNEVGALHLIPRELSLKICSKIEAGERFTVYVVVPLWPEGIPESGSVQAILDWQRRTMAMMYHDVILALKQKVSRKILEIT